MSTSPPTEEFGGGKQRRTLLWLILGGVVVVCIVTGTGYAIFGRGEPAPTPEPTVLADAVCDRVDATGTIVAGTAANYPPFEYYNDQFQLDGFDIALMTAVGQNLGVAVEFKDYAFDGLSNALELGEIDAAIAALTVTEARQAVVDFSDAYYFGRGAAIARTGEEPASITSPAGFAGWRVGVERGTVYQSWADKNLVATGVIPEQELFAYQTADDAVGDLLQDRLDVVLLDDSVATSFTSSGALGVVGEGGVIQQYAIAVPKDSACMRARTP